MLTSILQSFVFVPDYHLLAREGRRGRPANLEWPHGDKNQAVSNSNVYCFNYNTDAATHMQDLLSPRPLEDHARLLVRLLSDAIPQHAQKMYIILVGYGYGGLICEQVSSSDPIDRRAFKPLASIIKNTLTQALPRRHYWRNGKNPTTTLPCQDRYVG